MKIGVIGTVNMEVILGPASNLPRWGEQICVPELETRYMGSAASVALPLSRLGGEAVIVGTVGDDEAGLALRGSLQRQGLATEGIEVIKQAASGICVSLVRNDGEHVYVSSLGAIAALDEEMILAKRWPILSTSQLVLLTGLFLLPGLGIAGAISCFTKLQQQGVRTALDVGWDTAGWPEEHIEGVRRLLAVTDVFIPNQAEAEKIGEGESIEEIGRSLAKMGPGEVAIKMGKRGAVAVAEGEFVKDSGFPCDVRDTTAAGEAFNAGYLYGSCKGLPVKESLRLGNAVASMFLQNRTYPSLNSVEELIGKP